jgi:hypothetical protein
VPASCLGNSEKVSADIRWLLFCTHPLREVENTLSAKSRPFLTYYAFADVTEDELPVPLDPEGAEADEVHVFLNHAEQYALSGSLTGSESPKDIEEARKAGKIFKSWIEDVTRFGAASFLEEAKYFVPIPVALVRILPTRETEIHDLFAGNERAVHLAESIFSTIHERPDHTFRLSDIDAASKTAGCSPEDALGVLAMLTSPSVAKLRLELRSASGSGSIVTSAELTKRLRDWWKHKTVTDEEWNEWAESVEVRWIDSQNDTEAL